MGTYHPTVSSPFTQRIFGSYGQLRSREDHPGVLDPILNTGVAESSRVLGALSPPKKRQTIVPLA